MKKIVKKSVKRAENGLRAKSDNTSVRKPVVKNQPARIIAGREAMKDYERYDSTRKTPIKRGETLDQRKKTLDSLLASGNKKSQTAGGMAAVSGNSSNPQFNLSDYERVPNPKAVKKLSSMSKKKMGGKVMAKKVKSVTKIVKKAASKKK